MSVIKSCGMVVEVVPVILGGVSGVKYLINDFYTYLLVSRIAGGTYIRPSFGTYVGIYVPRGI